MGKQQIQKKFCTKCFVVAVGGLGIMLAAIAAFFLLFGQTSQQPREKEVDFEHTVSNQEVTLEESLEEGPEASTVECSNFECLEKYYQNLVVQSGAETAFADLKTRYKESGQARSFCHPLAHVIGRMAALQYSNVGEAFAQGDPFCWSGYYHGVMEGMLRETASQDVPAFINTICTGIPGKETYSFDYYNCVHGLGHGVMYITQNELFDALALCDHFEGQWEQESCYGGVFMENVITDFENHFTKYLKPQEPLYPCTVVPEKTKRACYLMQTSYVLKTNGYNFAHAFAQCSSVEEQHKNTCYQSIGRDASGSTVSDVERTKAYCLLGADERQQTQCVVGAVKDFISYFHSDIQAKQLCEAFAGDIAQTCHGVAVLYYRSFRQ